jgi:hypothetical protein
MLLEYLLTYIFEKLTLIDSKHIEFFPKMLNFTECLAGYCSSLLSIKD